MKIFSEDELRDFLQSKESIVIYGTGGMGGNLYQYLLRNNWLGKLSFFLVSENTQGDYEGIAVKGLHDLTEEEKLSTVVIATRQNFHEEIIRGLAEEGISDYHTMSEDVLNLIERLAMEMPGDEEKPQATAGEASAPGTGRTSPCGRGIQAVCGIHEYLEALAAHAGDWLILLAVRDTVGLHLDAEINRRLMTLGARDLMRKQWRGYGFVSCSGEVLADTMGTAGKGISETLEVQGLPISIESYPFHDGDRAVIRVGGHDYSMNSRGLNIVVFDLGKNQLVDSVGFDTHAKKLTCSRSDLYILPERCPRRELEPVAGDFVDKGLSDCQYEVGVRKLRRSLYGTWMQPGTAQPKERCNLSFFLEMCSREEPVVLPGEKISFLHTMDEIPVEELVRGVAREMGFPVGEACRMAEDVCLDFRSVLEKGLDGMTGEHPSEESARCRDAILSLAGRYAEEAHRIGNEAVAASFRRIPARPAETFAEAVQCVRFLLAMLSLAGHNGTVLGRMDQYLYPYWKRDLEAGRMTEQGAVELLREFFVSISRSGRKPSVTLGGCGSDGHPVFNDMTHRILELAAEGNLPPAVIVLRIAPETPGEIRGLAEKCHGLHSVMDSEILGSLGKQGIPEEFARDYVVTSHGEIALPGQIRSGRLDGEVSFLRAVKETEKEIGKEMKREDAEELLRDEIRIQVLGMLPYQTVHCLSSALLGLLAVKFEGSQEGAARRFYVPYGELEQASDAWRDLLLKAGIPDSGIGREETEHFLEDSLAEACERFSMFNKRLVPELRVTGGLS